MIRVHCMARAKVATAQHPDVLLHRAMLRASPSPYCRLCARVRCVGGCSSQLHRTSAALRWMRVSHMPRRGEWIAQCARHHEHGWALGGSDVAVYERAEHATKKAQLEMGLQRARSAAGSAWKKQHVLAMLEQHGRVLLHCRQVERIELRAIHCECAQVSHEKSQDWVAEQVEPGAVREGR